MKIRVFYAGLLYEEKDGDAIENWRHIKSACTPEIYNGSYLWFEKYQPTWYRMAGTPCLLSDVPKELQLLNILL